MATWKEMIHSGNFDSFAKRYVYSTLRFQSQVRSGGSAYYYYPEGDTLTNNAGRWTELDTGMSSIPQNEAWGGFLAPYNGFIKKVIINYYQNSYASIASYPVIQPSIWKYDDADATSGSEIFEGIAQTMIYQQIKTWDLESPTDSALDNATFDAGDIILPVFNQTSGVTGKTFHGTWTIVVCYVNMV
tara:strand:- start:3150 stop:3710 length:561 start_codon:yes stop_codon:yes gene_type:complete